MGTLTLGFDLAVRHTRRAFLKAALLSGLVLASCGQSQGPPAPPGTPPDSDLHDAKKRGRSPLDYFDFSRDTLRPRWIERPWGKLCVRQSGHGPALLALHGLGGSGRYWEGLAKQVADSFTVITIDLAGFGQSDKPWIKYDDLELHLGNIDAAVDGAKDLTIVGHSLGGLLAAVWAARNPQRVAALALVATPYGGAGTATDSEIAEADREQDQTGAVPALHRLICSVWQLVFQLPIRTPSYPRAIIQDYVRHTLHSYWSNARLTWEADLTPQLAGLTELAGRPKLLLRGDADRRVDVSSAEKYRKLMPDADFETVPGAGHQLLLETNFQPLLKWLLARQPPLR